MVHSSHAITNAHASDLLQKSRLTAAVVATSFSDTNCERWPNKQKVDGLQFAASRGDKVRDDSFPPFSSVLAESVQFLSLCDRVFDNDDFLGHVTLPKKSPLTASPSGGHFLQ